MEFSSKGGDFEYSMASDDEKVMKREKVKRFLSHKVKMSDLEAGDHIYTWRKGFSYSHHGIYVSEDRVVHLNIPKSSLQCNSSLASSIPCGFYTGRGIMASCLSCFIRDGSLYRYKYGANVFDYTAKVRGGTCTTAKSDDPGVVIHRAKYLLDKGYGEYNLFKNNCEDFALYCKTGLLVSHSKEAVGGSGQASYVKAIFARPASILSRVKYDIGYRTDVDKVEVEDVAAYLSNSLPKNVFKIGFLASSSDIFKTN